MLINKKDIPIIFFILVLAVFGVSSFLLLTTKAPVKQSAPKVFKVGILNGFDYVGNNADGFKAGMTELGYIEGKNIVYNYQKTNPVVEEYDAALQKIVDDKVDLMFTFPTEASLEGKKFDKQYGIPLVFSNADFEGVDLLNTVKEPGNNLTGVRYPGPDVALKRLEVLMKMLPNSKTILMPYLATYPIVPSQLKLLREWAPKLGVDIIEMPVNSPEELQTSLDAFAKSGKKVDAILTIVEVLSGDPTYAAIWGKWAFDNKIPTGGIVLLKKNGYQYETLFGVDIDGFASGKQAATLADKILKGTPAGTIPVPSAEMFVKVNYRLATEMGIPLSEGFLGSVNEIIR
jgi:putative tryptophan/tyrosine transport system substrate-binding protein